MGRRTAEPEDIFIDTLKILLKNLLIENPNYPCKGSNYYFSKNDPFHLLLDDTKERANFILEKIEDLKHLVKPGEIKL